MPRPTPIGLVTSSLGWNGSAASPPRCCDSSGVETRPAAWTAPSDPRKHLRFMRGSFPFVVLPGVNGAGACPPIPFGVPAASCQYSNRIRTRRKPCEVHIPKFATCFTLSTSAPETYESAYQFCDFGNGRFEVHNPGSGGSPLRSEEHTSELQS